MSKKHKTSSTNISQKPKRAKPETAPQFEAAHAVIFGVVCVAAAASTMAAVATVGHFGLHPLAFVAVGAVAGALALLIALVPILMAPAWALARGNQKWIGFALIAMMMVPDALLQTNAVREAGVAFQAPVIERLETKLETLEAEGASAASINSAAYRLREANKPSVNLTLISVVMALFQIATFFIRAWLTQLTRDRNAELKAERAAKRAPKTQAQPNVIKLKDRIRRDKEPGPRFAMAA